LKKAFCLFWGLLLLLITKSPAQQQPVISQAGMGWAGNSVNTVVFRKNSVVTHGNIQYIAYYDSTGHVVLGKRNLPAGKWEIKQTSFKGNISDAHNAISIMADGKGFLHIAWDHHNHPLRYARSISPGSLELGPKMPMTGISEQKVTYPEFHRLPGGDLIFLYRDGQSGEGNLVLNRYDLKTGTWKQLYSNLIDGEKQRNAYWQACIDTRGTIHLSWVWRETGDVATNHDLCYARSADGGISWTRSTGERYRLPINASNAEYVARIPQKSELINQTSMYADEDGKPFIASYWREEKDSVPQYHLAYISDGGWKILNTGFRKKAFSLSGGGTKRIPISRPQIVAWKNRNAQSCIIIFRDEERGSRISAALCKDIRVNNWHLQDLSPEAVGSWEPSYDTELWKRTKTLALFVQYTDQKDSEGRSDLPAQAVSVLLWDPKKSNAGAGE
jgi:hypothetical protein